MKFRRGYKAWLAPQVVCTRCFLAQTTVSMARCAELESIISVSLIRSVVLDSQLHKDCYIIRELKLAPIHKSKISHEEDHRYTLSRGWKKAWCLSSLLIDWNESHVIPLVFKKWTLLCIELRQIYYTIAAGLQLTGSLNGMQTGSYEDRHMCILVLSSWIRTMTSIL